MQRQQRPTAMHDRILRWGSTPPLDPDIFNIVDKEAMTRATGALLDHNVCKGDFIAITLIKRVDQGTDILPL